MRKEAEPDWERQLESVVNDQALRAISRRPDALASIENGRMGPNQLTAKVIASKLGTRQRAIDDIEDWARIVETRVSRRLHQLVAEGSSVTVRAVDALRNHVEILSDEVSASNNSALRCRKSLEALERRVGLLEDDVGNELLRLRNHVNAREDALQSSLQRVQGQIDSLSERSEKTISERVERQISDSIQPFQRNLVETIQQVVKGEVAQSQRKCLDMIEARFGEQQEKGRDESVKLTTKIITRSITNLEKSLRIGLEGKIEEQLRERKQHQSKLLQYQMEKELTSELSPIHDALHEMDKRLSTCLSRRRAETLVESTRSSATEDMEQLEGRLKQAILDVKSNLDSSLERLSTGQGRLTKESQNDVLALVTEGNKTQLEQEVERKVLHEISILNTQNHDQHRPVQFAVEKLQARLTDLEGVLNDKLCSPQETAESASSSDIKGAASKVEEHFDVKLMNKCLDVVEEVEGRLGKLELDRPRDLESKLTSRISELEQIMGEIPEQLKTIGDEIAKRGSSLGRNLSFDESIDDLHSALQEAKRLASSHKKPPLSTVACNHTSEKSSKASDTASPSSIAHLLGLGTPSGTASTRSSPSPIVASQNAKKDQEGDSECKSKSQGTTEEFDLTEARNRMLSDVARTLSSVGSRRDDPSLKDLAARMRAGKLAGENYSPKTSPSIQSSDRGSPGSGESMSRAASVDTAEALSLCGMKLPESDSPASLGGSIATNEALDLCGTEHLIATEALAREESVTGMELEPSTPVRREKSLIAGHTSTRSLLDCKTSETAEKLSSSSPRA